MTIKKEFTVERDNKTFVLYAGLLDLAHEQGLKAITTTLVQIPNSLNDNTAICHATVETEKGTFTGIGDAAPSNVNRMMANALIRMAETRAKARALRDAVNVGMAALEELADDDEAPAARKRTTRAPQQGVVTQAAAVAQRAARQLHPVEAPLDDDRWPMRAPAAPAPAATAAPAQNGVAHGGPMATPKQLETIARMARAAGKHVETDGLTRAQASEIISSLIGEMGERTHA